VWSLWHHSLHDDCWDIESYIRIFRLETVLEVVEMLEHLAGVSEHWGHMFLMREGILPIYEDPHNAAGGCWSFKAPNKRRIVDAWSFFVKGTVGELLRHEDVPFESITGISLNPKTGFIKIWMSRPGIFPFAEHPPWVHQDRAMWLPHQQKMVKRT
jgi:hypothetical protein